MFMEVFIPFLGGGFPGAVAGGVVGGIILITIAIVTVLVWWKRQVPWLTQPSHKNLHSWDVQEIHYIVLVVSIMSTMAIMLFQWYWC